MDTVNLKATLIAIAVLSIFVIIKWFIKKALQNYYDKRDILNTDKNKKELQKLRFL